MNWARLSIHSNRDRLIDDNVDRSFDKSKGGFGDRFQKFEKAWQRDGLWYLASMRMAPYVPFFSINLLMGLTPVKARAFFIVSQIAMLPGTIVNLYLGSRLPPLNDLKELGIPALITWELALAFSLLAVTPLLIRHFLKRRVQS